MADIQKNLGENLLNKINQGKKNMASSSSPFNLPKAQSRNSNRHKKNDKPDSEKSEDEKKKEQFQQNMAAIKKKALTEGIKKVGQAYGVPEAATETVLNSKQGQEVLDAATDAPTVTQGVMQASWLVTKKVLIVALISIGVPLFILLVILLLLFSRDSMSGFGDETSTFEGIREIIAQEIAKNKYKVDVDGELILATLIAYNDMSQIESESFGAKNINYIKRQIPELAKYQIVTNTFCEYDSFTIRQIASNDSILGENNYNCIPIDVTTYTLSIEQGDSNDDNSGSAYYWNLIDENFIFNYYNEYMINRETNTEENREKIDEIIDEIYMYYQTLKDIDEEMSFSYYITDDEYWWPVGSLETTTIDGKLFATGYPSSIGISSYFSEISSIRNNNAHTGLDIYSVGRGTNYHNIIASKSGVVVYPSNLFQVQNLDSIYVNGTFLRKTQSNTVIIAHDDGNYTAYGHLYGGSVTVKAGDYVKQGQVIGKMGSSGNSTGPHVHFEIRIGANTNRNAVDPLTFISSSNPRPITTKSSNNNDK